MGYPISLAVESMTRDEVLDSIRECVPGCLKRICGDECAISSLVDVFTRNGVLGLSRLRRLLCRVTCENDATVDAEGEPVSVQDAFERYSAGLAPGLDALCDDKCWDLLAYILNAFGLSTLVRALAIACATCQVQPATVNPPGAPVPQEPPQQIDPPPPQPPVACPLLDATVLQTMKEE